MINLERSTQRRERMRAALMQLNLPARFIAAVDGRALSEADLACYNRRRALQVYGADMTPAEIGCCLSHLRVLEEVVQQKLDHALVFEDDLLFEPHFVSVVQDILALPDIGWQVVRLNALKHSVLSPRTAWDVGTAVARLNDGTLYRVNRNPLGAGAYLVTRRGAEAILSHASPVFAPYDHMLDRFWENGILPYVVRPFPVRQDSAVVSDIGWPRGTGLVSAVSPLVYACKRLQRVSDSLRKRRFLARVRQKGAV